MNLVIIAELCQNHSGKIKSVLDMCDAAAEAGATHIKLQHIFVRNLAFRERFEFDYRSCNDNRGITRPWKNEMERLLPLELTDSDYRQFVMHVESLGCVPMTTCFAKSDALSIYNQGFRSIKVASYDCASYPMLRVLAEIFSTIYISTGATNHAEVIKTIALMDSYLKPYHLLHCVTQYPTKLNMTLLSRMSFLKEITESVGFSDHSSPISTGICASLVAIYLGATCLERHFTIFDRNSTKDGIVSVNPKELAEIAMFSRLNKSDQKNYLCTLYPFWECTVGCYDPRGSLSEEENLNRDYYRGRFGSPVQILTEPPHVIQPNWVE